MSSRSPYRKHRSWITLFTNPYRPALGRPRQLLWCNRQGPKQHRWRPSLGFDAGWLAPRSRLVLPMVGPVGGRVGPVGGRSPLLQEDPTRSVVGGGSVRRSDLVWRRELGPRNVSPTSVWRSNAA